MIFNEWDLLCILDDKSGPDWWKARGKLSRIYSDDIITNISRYHVSNAKF